MRILATACFLLTIIAHTVANKRLESISTTVPTMMESTFRLEVGNGYGSCFILGHPVSSLKGSNYIILVTAKHVISKGSDDAVIHLRKAAETGTERLKYKFKIRQNGKPLWKEHPTEDVAVIPFNPANEALIRSVTIFSTGILANDTIVKKLNIGPGDELMVIGYPLGAESNELGYPLLRSGRIASYPLVPSSQYRSFYLDIEIFPGNSGGPVFLYDRSRYYDGKIQLGLSRTICGLVSAEKIHPETIQTLEGLAVKKHKLALAKIVQASSIRETIELLYPNDPIPKPDFVEN